MALAGPLFTSESKEPWWRLYAHSWTEGRDIEVILKDTSTSGDGGRRIVTCKSVLDYSLTDPSVGAEVLLLDTEHPLIRQYTDSYYTAYFTGSPTSALHVARDILYSHLTVARDWISPYKYLNARMELEDLLRTGHGELAFGPGFLVEAYKAAVQSHEVDCHLSGPSKFKHWTGVEYVELQSPPVAISIGHAWIVSEFVVVEPAAN